MNGDSIALLHGLATQSVQRVILARKKETILVWSRKKLKELNKPIMKETYISYISLLRFGIQIMEAC